MKKKIILCLTALILLVTSGCKNKETSRPKGYVQPTITNPSEIVYQNSFNNKNFDITKEELYEEIKINDGLTKLLELVDKQLFSSYLSLVTEDEITNKVNYLTYGLTEQESLDLINDETKEKTKNEFMEGMYILGYKTEAAVRDYAKLLVAQEKYVKEYLDEHSTIKKDTYFIKDSTIESYYTSTYFKDVKALIIQFDSEQDAKNALKSLNLVKYNGKLCEYTGTQDINTISASQLNASNTKELTDEEVFSYYVKMYNDVYGGVKEKINEALTIEEFINQDTDNKFNYNINKLAASNYNLAEYLFKKLNLTTNRWSVDAKKANISSDNNHYFVFKLTEPEKKEFKNLTETELEETKTEIISLINETKMLTASTVQSIIYKYRLEKNLEFYDFYLGLDYNKIDTNYQKTNKGDNKIVVKADGVEITADELYEYTSTNNFEVYVINASVGEIAFLVDQYTKFYGTELNVEKNKSEKMQEYKDALKTIKESYTATDVLYLDYLYLAVGAKSELDVITDYFIRNEMKSFMVMNSLMDIKNHFYEDVRTTIMNKVNELYDNYFSLNVSHILFYVDLNEDGIPDDFHKYLTNASEYKFHDLNGQLITNYAEYYETLSEELNTLLNETLGEEATSADLQNLVKEFNNSKRNDVNNKWAKFRNLGFKLIYENLSSSSSLTYEAVKDSYDKDFVDRLIELNKIYKEKLEVEKAKDDNDTTKKTYTTYVDEELTKSSFGLHKIVVSKGTSFDAPSCKFADEDGEYAFSTLNANDRPNSAQVETYFVNAFYTNVYGTGIDVESKYNITIPKINSTLSANLEI